MTPNIPVMDVSINVLAPQKATVQFEFDICVKWTVSIALFCLCKYCTGCILGGLLISLPREQAAAFCKDIEKQEGYQAWIIGIVEKGNRSARIIDKPRVIEVPAKDKDGELW